MTNQPASRLSPEAYGILEDCKCGPEPFFVLVSSVDFEDELALSRFTQILIDLVENGLLSAEKDAEPLEALSLRDLEVYVRDRLTAGEVLEEPPSSSAEYSFTTTEAGILLLKPEDRPVARPT